MPVPPKRVLVPIDFSRVSLYAWELAKQLFEPMGAKLEALFVYESPIYYGEGFPLPPLSEQDRREIQRHLRERIGDHEALVAEGSPGPSILDVARQRGTDLIAMGTHGRTGIPRVLLGSVAEHVIRNSQVPILALRGESQRVESILAPINFETYSIKGFLVAAQLAELLGARVDGVFVEAPGATRKAVESAYQALVRGLSPYFTHRHPWLMTRRGEPTKEIVSAAGKYDLLVLVAHRKSFFHELVLGTTVERVLRHSPVPVLAVPDPEAGAPGDKECHAADVSRQSHR